VASMMMIWIHLHCNTYQNLKFKKQ